MPPAVDAGAAFQRAKDDIVALAYDRAMVEAIKAWGDDATLTVYPDAGHDPWRRTCEDSTRYDWMRARCRPTAAQRRRVSR
jgi:hypothetical protein